MGFNIRILDKQRCFDALSDKGLLWLYGKSDMLLFDDEVSSRIYGLYQEGKNESEILLIINQNMEEKTNEVY